LNTTLVLRCLTSADAVLHRSITAILRKLNRSMTLQSGIIACLRIVSVSQINSLHSYMHFQSINPGQALLIFKLYNGACRQLSFVFK